MNGRYLISLPERSLRAVAAGLGGFFYEVTVVALPFWLRRTRIYRAIVQGLLRITIELIGGAAGILPPDDMDVQELATRKAAGTGIEFIGLLTIGWSPLWLFALTADLTGGTRTYLEALVSELRKVGLLSSDGDISTVEELLDVLEESSGLVAETIDVPPLNVDDMRNSWQELRQKTGDLPDAERLANTYAQLRQTADREESSLWSLSSLMATSAARAGIQVGKVHIFDYYDVSLRSIAAEGLAAYMLRVTRPYRGVALSHFDPGRMTYTERLLRSPNRSSSR